MTQTRGSAGAPPPSVVLLQMSNVVVPRALYVAAKLGIADLIAERPKSAGDLAAATGTHAPSLYRVLRLLASLGIFVEQDDGRFALTPLAGPLRADAPDSVRLRLLMSGELSYGAVSDLLYSVQTGEPAFERLHGMGWWEYFAAHPDEAALLDAVFARQSAALAGALLAAYDFAGIDLLVDVGGGFGGLLLPILRAHPPMRGIVFDLPHVEHGAAERIRAAGLEDRCAFVGGDFFEAVPVGGDAYVLKSILRDWDDERAGAILRRCREALAPGGRLLVIDFVVPPDNEPGIAKQADVSLLTFIRGAADRTEAQFPALLGASGFSLRRVVSLAAGPALLEAVPSKDR